MKRECKILAQFFQLGVKDDAFYDATQLALGVTVEQEHLQEIKKYCPELTTLLAKKIAKDHLEELPDYYTRLQHMESKL